MKLPNARNTDIVIQEAGKEVLLYDLKTNKAYNLNETSALIYNHCDGKTNFADLKLKYRNLSDDIIYFALDELKSNNLIEGEYKSLFAGLSRREVIRKVGLASMMAIPVIISITAPKSAQAQSSLLPLLATCTQSPQCASGNCGNAIGGGGNCCIAVRNSGCSSNAECCQRNLSGGGSCIGGNCCFAIGFNCALTPANCCSGNCDIGGSGNCI